MEYSQRHESCQPRTTRQVDVWRGALARRLWPSICVLCARAGQPSIDLCAGCESDLVLNASACAVCGAPLAGASELLCGACLRRRPHYHAVIAPFRYAYPLDRLIQRLKYGQDLSCGRVLGELLARKLLSDHRGELPQCLLPIPLGPQRYCARGYNQAHEVALPLARRTGVPLRTDILERSRDTIEQAALSGRERRKNLRGAFTVRTPIPFRHVAIIDDVVTTGSTANEVAKVLRRARVEKVEVWSVARTPLRTGH